MGFFPNTVAAKLAGREIAAAHLVFFDFVGQPIRMWPGFGPLATLDGNTWEGTGGLGAIEGLGQPIGGNAPQITFRLSGVDMRLVALARMSSSAVKRRPATVFLQVFDLHGDPRFPDLVAPKLLDQPFVVAALTLDTLTYSLGPGPSTASISLTAETINYGRRRAPYSLVCDRDQQDRYAGDLGLSRVGGSGIQKTLITPW